MNHLKPDCTPLILHLQLLFQMCLCYSIVPDSFLCGTVTSILKRGKDPFSCSSYCPITISCTLSKVLEYLLLPSITDNINFGVNQFGFQCGLGCQHAHKVLSTLLSDAFGKGYDLYFCSLDLSKAFDSVVHSQALFSLLKCGVNVSIVSLLKSWYGHSFLYVKSSPSDPSILKITIRQGGVLSPSIFKICIADILNSLPTTYLLGSSNVSYLAYADNILLISRTKSGLSTSVCSISTAFSNVGLTLNPDKCEFLNFGPSSNQYSRLNCSEFSILCVTSLRWLGITLYNNLVSFCNKIVSDAKVKLQVGYSKIVANRGKYNHKAYSQIYSCFCDHSFLYLSGLYPV